MQYMQELIQQELLQQAAQPPLPLPQPSLPSLKQPPTPTSLPPMPTPLTPQASKPSPCGAQLPHPLPDAARAHTSGSQAVPMPAWMELAASADPAGWTEASLEKQPLLVLRHTPLSKRKR